MRRLLLLPVAAVALWSAAARGDDKTQCFDAASQGQTLRDAHKLVDARAAFAVCARPVCPKPVAKDCTAWLEQVEQALPTIVVAASDGAGHDLFDVTVTIDGHPLAAKLMGEAVPVDPGPHTFHFETPDGGRLDHQALVREGVKNQAIDVVIAPPAKAAAAPAAPAATAPTVPPAGEAPAGGGSSPWRTIGFVSGGVGIAGLGVGVAFGLMAMGDKNDAQCDSSGACKAGALSNARGAANVSTASFIGGGVLLAAGTVLVVWAPGGRAAETHALRVSPLVGSRDAGLLLTGGW